MAQEVSRQSLTTKARVRARVSLCGICDGKSGSGTGFSQSSSVLACQYHSALTLHAHISGDEKKSPLVAVVLRHSLIHQHE
jgi:hypothetical protein